VSRLDFEIERSEVKVTTRSEGTVIDGLPSRNKFA